MVVEVVDEGDLPWWVVDELVAAVRFFGDDGDDNEGILDKCVGKNDAHDD